MGNSVSPHIQRVVSKLSTNLTPQDAVDAFWDRSKPGTKENMGPEQVEHYEQQVRAAFRDHQRNEARHALDMVA